MAESEFKKLKSILPVSIPFICPDCNAEHKHFLNLSTHYLTQHGHLKTWLDEKGIQYEPNRKVRSLASRAPATDIKPQQEELPAVQEKVVERTAVKHPLSASESEETGEEEEGREYLVSRPLARTALQEALSFLTQDKTAPPTEVKQEVVVKTELLEDAGNKPNEISTSDTPEKESIESDTETKQEVRKMRRKRPKKATDYDLSEVLGTLLDQPSSGDPEPWAAEPPPARVMTTVVLEADPPPHLWLCDGRLLVLQENLHENNLRLFQEQWRRGQPVIVANMSNNLDMNLWSPQAFNDQFGDLKHNIINCKTHKMIPKVIYWFKPNYSEC